MSSAPGIMLFNLYHGGHHEQYVTYLVQYWMEHRPGRRLDVVVPNRSLEKNTTFRALLSDAAAHDVYVHPVEAELPVGQPGLVQLLSSDAEHGRVLRRMVKTLRPDHCVLMYLDQVQLSLALDLRFAQPLTFSGIYFRPSFHYARLGTGSSGVKERITSVRKRAMLAAAVRNRHFRVLFSLDPFVLEYLPAMPARVQPVWLPDPVQINEATESPESFRRHWGISSDRTLGVLFGVIDARKGVHELIRAATALSPDLQARLCLALFGPVDPDDAALHAGLQTLRRDHAVQVVVNDQFVDQSEGQTVLESADFVALPYRHHVGSSNVLIRAARAGRPVLGSNYGIMGRQIDTHGLGVSVDCTDVNALSKALSRFIEDPGSVPFDATRSAAFAAANTSEKFAETIFSGILQSPKSVEETVE